MKGKKVEERGQKYESEGFLTHLLVRQEIVLAGLGG